MRHWHLSPRFVPRRLPHMCTSDATVCPLTKEWIRISETCVRCPEYREEYFIPFVSTSGRECRFFFEWWRSVDEAKAADTRPTHLGWGFMDPDSLEEWFKKDNEPVKPNPELTKQDDERLREALRIVFGSHDEDDQEFLSEGDEEPEWDEEDDIEEEEEDGECW